MEEQESRRNTKSGRDFAYWCRMDIGDEFPVAIDEGLTTFNLPDGLNGFDLVNYGLEQVGLRTHLSLSFLRTAAMKGTPYSIADALRTPGCLLFAGDYVGITTLVRGVTIEPLGRRYRLVSNASPVVMQRWAHAYMYPEMAP